MELEDDLFFADLNKQISLLIMDEDEQEGPLACSPPEPLQAFSGAIIHHPPPLSVIVYEQGVRRTSKGTGVFIPQSIQPRRRHRRGRSGSYAKHQKQSEDTRMVSQAPDNSYSFRSRNG